MPLLSQECFLNDEIRQAPLMSFASIKGNVVQYVTMSSREDITEEEIKCVLSQFSNDKSRGWDGIMNKFFKSLHSLNNLKIV